MRRRYPRTAPLSRLEQRPFRFLPSILFVILIGIVLIPLLHGRLVIPPILPAVHPLAWQLLPAAGLSLLRMGAAYAICVVLAISVGTWAALDARSRRFIIPTLDVLQSVPVLGFFPAAVLFFVNAFQGSPLGVEFASVFLLVTCQAWNMIFGVYESLITRPRDLDEMGDAFHLSFPLRMVRYYVPLMTPKLLYNSMLSWANGWYFLVACEIIAIGPARYELTGLGSFLARSAAGGDFGLFTLGLGTLVLVIVALDLFIWRPLISWAERFRVDGGELGVPSRETPFVQFWTGIWKSNLVERLTRSAGASLGAAGRVLIRVLEPVLRRTPRVPRPIPRAAARWLGWTLLAGVALLAVGGAANLIRFVLEHPPSREAYRIPWLTCLSLLRLLVAYGIGLAWTIPMALWVASSRRAGRFLLPLFEIMAAIPVTALFPALAFALGATAFGRQSTAVLLALTGMQWYLLFNFLAGIRSVPSDVAEATRAMGLRRSLMLRRVIVPASLSSLVTGSITAWGGGWNSLILSEYFVYRGEVNSTPGLGSLISRATYETGDLTLLLLGLGAMVIANTLMNRFVWRPLYDHVAERYRHEG